VPSSVRPAKDASDGGSAYAVSVYPDNGSSCAIPICEDGSSGCATSTCDVAATPSCTTSTKGTMVVLSSVRSPVPAEAYGTSLVGAVAVLVLLLLTSDAAGPTLGT
jgi:hypothetical protein